MLAAPAAHSDSNGSSDNFTSTQDCSRSTLSTSIPLCSLGCLLDTSTKPLLSANSDSALKAASLKE